ncbi:ATP-binding protein [Brotaphodocola catenula]|uniref:Stage 0 sporulation protein A homolog n=1 Tax=Brotaphodocola catenula TaxID=2885361 RepID=A0AAE3ATV9_9FIRM|nr:ATP-binding protein [Brotaphodocola catenula]MCC2165834.1 response regulator [Brotaphodocola catenula]
MQKAKSYRKLIWGCCMTGIAMLLAFFFLYQTYIQDIIYEERLNQMEEITRQMFQNLEDVIDSHWDRVTEECNYLRDANVQTTDELCRYMKKKYDLSAYADHKITLMAVDSEGGYYTESGNRGLFRELGYFEDNPELISFVFYSMTDNLSEMVFLKRLPEPIELQNGEEKTTISYFGIAQNMEQLNPYFSCDAYNGNNSVYILDDNGFKLFNSNQVELIKGHNVFSVLQKMKYLHNSSFDKTRAELEEKGCSYSNAVLDGTEYFYGLKRMENAEWTLIFLVPAEYVATNTLRLVNFVTIFIVIFTVIVSVCVILGISFVMHRNQQEAIRVERENNAKLETVNTELRQAKQAAEEAFQVAQEASRSKSSFLANMSHDIRTPMNAIIGMTSLIRYDAGDKARVIEYADKIDTSSQHLLGIINDILDMSKIEAGKTVFKYSDFSIVDFIQELDTIFHSQIYEKQQTFTIIKENIRHEWVNGDRVHLMQIFSNLLSNAIKYTQEGGEIQILAEECESNSSVYAKYRFLVSDNGMGMSADFKNTIFDTFTREENSLTNKIQGTGLGMAITKNLVDSMGGTIDVESEPGQGSSFEIFMDLKIVEEGFISPALQAETDNQDGNILQGMRFLCAEDNELNAEILTELLKIEGAECTVCENGERVLETFERSIPGEYDMILMDVQMPVMNGYEATKAIRRSSHELAKKIPIIAMTANAFSEDIQHSLAAGMNAHVSKPVEIKVLEKTIRSIKSGGGGYRTAGH